ncbi:MAG: hypothetical protein WD342_12940 [Verrucomicrobiales bacterium]
MTFSRRPFLAALAISVIFFAAGTPASSEEIAEAASAIVECEGDYDKHLQGVCLDGEGNIYWSFTTELVKTDPDGKRLQQVPVDNHHGDLCFRDGKVYVAVNLGKFNDPAGNADSWIHVYDARNLREIARHSVPEVFHGAGGMDSREGCFFVVGGLPEGVEENYVYEYDGEFRFVEKHIIESGWTRLGIQTAAWHEGAWWFGCYGSQAILLKTDADFRLLGRYEENASLGIAGVAPGRFLVAEGPRTGDGRHRGILRPARPDAKRGLVRIGK